MAHSLIRRLAAAGLAVAAMLLPAAALALSCRPATPLEAAAYVSPYTSPGVISPVDGTCWLPGQWVTGSDGVRMTANVFLPAGAGSGKSFPGVVFIASWAFTDFFEYLGQQQRLAQEGYVAMAYTPRGFWLSEGLVGVAGPQDVADVSSAVTWLLQNTPTDPQRVAASGISYGAGLSLMALAADPRLKTVTALSGWGNLIDQLYTQDTPNPTWQSVLFLSGLVTGRLDPIVAEYTAAILNPNTPAAKIEEIKAWAAQRSPSSVVAAINQRQAPVFISKNMQDDMFISNSSLLMFSQLTGPKKFLLNPGVHAMTEIPGATLGLPNYPMDQARRWLNRWLKDERNGIDTEPQVDLQRKLSTQRETLSTWPAPELKTTRYHLAPRGSYRWDLGCLCFKGAYGTLGTATSKAAGTDTVNNFFDTTATTGPIPILSTTGEGLNLPVINQMDTVAWAHGVRYEGPRLSSTMKIRGIPKLNLRIKPSQSRGLLVGYLYDVDPLGFGTLITHGSRALHWAQPGAVVDFPLELVATAYDVPAGHHVVMVFDTTDHLYGPVVNLGEFFSMGLVFSANRALTLDLPVR